jgi:hypothetical protein
VRKRQFDSGKPTPLPHVEIIQGASLYPDDNFTRSRLWVGYVLIDQSVDAAVLVEPYCFH